MNKDIILTTLNSRFSHSSLSLRYLYANMHELQHSSKILEFVINSQTQVIAEEILEYCPKIVGLSTYIWNATEISQIIKIIKKVSPKTMIILGGPEVSHKPFRVNFDVADYIISGEGEELFYRLCKDILDNNPPKEKFLYSKGVDFSKIKLPYEYYTDFDIQNRHIYIESSRGCPFECEFCLSSIDLKMRYLPLEVVLDELEKLWQRGARNFKFIDRTFNVKISYAKAILEYFLAKNEEYFLHFEVIPDNFPDELRVLLTRFAPQSLQLEVGIQTLNLEIAKNIKRNLRLAKIKENINFLETQTKAHLHVDLIVGLPAETLQSFAANLDELYSITKSEIQIGILKKLSGTTLDRHDIEYGMIYNDEPPYDILQNDFIDFFTMQKMKRFARFWDIVYNSGNFIKTSKVLFENGRVFDNFYDFSEWLYKRSESTYKISLDRIAEYLYEYLIKKYDKDMIALTILEDIMSVEGRKVPAFLKPLIPKEYDIAQKEVSKANKRQQLRDL
ncbi:MAG: DUF4080 domain-containing protein [Arcobacteraceae bacterium]|jgi:radical SAM superfamily enzyme YgiQ (UPF0313 family)|nr:DUF4080 domain-containing protein [Arcobacteraceae bacterium]